MNFRTEDDVVHRKYFRLLKDLVVINRVAIIEVNKKFTLYELKLYHQSYDIC